MRLNAALPAAGPFPFELPDTGESAGSGLSPDTLTTRSITDTVENLQEAFTLLDRAGDYIYVNQQAALMAGRTPAELIGANAWNLYPESRTGPIYDAVQEVFETQVAVHIEVLPPAAERPLSMSFYPQGEHVAIFTRNNTEREHAEQARRFRETRYERAFDASPDGLLITRESDGTIQEVNDRFLQIAGLRRQETIGRTAAELELWPDRAERELARELLHRQGFLRDFRTTLRPFHSGQNRIVRISTERLLTPEEPMLLSVVRDITEQDERHAEIQQQNQRLQRSLRETHHRVKNNLQTVSALIDLLGMQYDKVMPVNELTRLSQHIIALAAVHDLLTQQVRDTGDIATVSIAAALDQVLPMLRTIFEEREIDVAVVDIRLPVRQAISVTVLVNELVSNAVKHGRGKVTVRFLPQPDGEAVLEVSDEGAGFPFGFSPEHSANTGFDLIESLVCNDLGGTISYTNGAEGGAHIHLRFPLNPSEVAAA